MKKEPKGLTGKAGKKTITMEGQNKQKIYIHSEPMMKKKKGC